MIRVEPARGQVPHLLGEIKKRAAVNERVLVTTLTKRLAEDLSSYLIEEGVRCQWLHSELDAFERVRVLRELREQKFDALGRRQPAPRGARPAGSVAGRHSRCGQGRVSTE